MNSDDPDDDAAIWGLTHESWRCAIAREYLGADHAEAGREQDVTTLEDWRGLARYAVLQMRAALPLAVRGAGIGDAIGTTQYEVPQSLDRVEVIFNDQGLAPGWHHVHVGSRIGFALTMVRQEAGWTVERVERDWVMPEWLSGLPQ